MKKSAYRIASVLGAAGLLVITTSVAPSAAAAPVDSVKGHGSTATLADFDVNVSGDSQAVTGSFSYISGNDRGTVQATCIFVDGRYAVVAGRAPAGDSTVPHIAILAVEETSGKTPDRVSITFELDDVKNDCVLHPAADQDLLKGKVNITDN